MDPTSDKANGSGDHNAAADIRRIPDLCCHGAHVQHPELLAPAASHVDSDSQYACARSSFHRASRDGVRLGVCGHACVKACAYAGLQA